MQNLEHIVAIIPARGGSKGIPRKNIYPVGGKPLIYWTIDQCKRAPSISATYVSTDDDEIARVSEQYGAQVIRRPADISGDGAPSEAALIHALDVIERRSSKKVDLVVFPQATSPLRHPEDFERGIEVMRRTSADSLFSCVVLEDFCIWEKHGDEYQSLTYDYRNRRPRQQWPRRFLENGSFYMVLPDCLRRNGNRLGGRIEVCEMEPWKAVQVDSLEDVRLVEYYIGRISS